ncbi:MAG: DoxX family protein [Owenweeksia sp.]|nr:DoxX family protein [Owenweeksia sp.]
MKFVTQLARVLVGLLFIFSGLIKLNDPVGFSYKLHDYFAPGVLDLPFLNPFTLELAVFIVILEVMLGVALLIGFWRKLTGWLLLLMIVFFTFLTFYSAYFNKVTDCGCFGDAIPLTPWQSFRKDVILLVLILIIVINLHYIKPLLNRTGRAIIMVLALIGCLLFGIHVLNHLPVMDFRPYAEGKSIVEGLKSADELGLEPTRYGTVYYLKNTETGEEQKVSSDEYVSQKWYEKEDWKMLKDKTETVVLEKGYEPPVHDFILTLNDRDATDSLLNSPAIFLLVAYHIDETEEAAYPAINEFAEKAQSHGVPFIGTSASLADEVETMRHELQTPFPFGTMDETTLKTIIRSNPGILLLKKGKVAAKWHYQDLPLFEEVKENHL